MTIIFSSKSSKLVWNSSRLYLERAYVDEKHLAEMVEKLGEVVNNDPGERSLVRDRKDR